MAGNREAWLTEVAGRIEADLFRPEAITLPRVMVSVGFPSARGLSRSRRVIGQCWRQETSATGASHLFISPLLVDPVEVGATLVHELVHAADDCKSGHKGFFRRTAKLLGLEGPMTATHAGEALKGKLIEIAQKVGDYPHEAFKPKAKPKVAAKRMCHFKCAECDYSLWTTWKCADMGTPTCPCCSDVMDVPE